MSAPVKVDRYMTDSERAGRHRSHSDCALRHMKKDSISGMNIVYREERLYFGNEYCVPHQMGATALMIRPDSASDF